LSRATVDITDIPDEANKFAGTEVLGRRLIEIGLKVKI